MNLKDKFLNQILYNIKNYEFWLIPSVIELKKKYKKTKIGPFWNLLSNIILMSIISLVWTQIFKIKLIDFFPHMFIGLTLWYFITEVLVGSCSLITEKYESIFQNRDITLINLIFRNFFYSFFIYIHNIPVFLILFITSNNDYLINFLLLMIGIILLSLNLIWLSIVLTFIGTKYRDIKPLISVIMSGGILLTPIMWKKEMLGQFSNYIYLNPFVYFIDVIRMPMLAEKIQFFVYWVNIFLIIIGFLFCNLIFKKYGKKIVFWI